MDSRTATLLLRRAIDQGLLGSSAVEGIKRASPAERADALLAALRATGVGSDGVAWMVLAAESATRIPEIPGYQLGELIGWGAAGGVWRAVQDAVGRDIALKVVPLGRGADAAGFIAEVHALGQLNHPHVVTCHDAGTTGDRLYLAMEVLTGGDAERLRRSAGGRLDETRALSIVRDAALGLIAISGAGLVHRDLNPANLLLTAEGRAKIGDLGLARPSGPAHGASWAVQGTPAFWSPEQVRGAALDVRSDIHALGATLYTLLCGQPPYAGATILDLIRAIGERQVPDPATLLPEISDAARIILLTTLAKDPAMRHATAEALAEDLHAALAGSTPVHARALRLKAFASAEKRQSVLPSSSTTVASGPGASGSVASGSPINNSTTPAHNGVRGLPTSAVLGGVLALGLGIGFAMSGPNSSEERALRSARITSTTAGWTDFLTRFPSSANAAEARASVRLLSQLPVAPSEPSTDPQVVRLRGELRSLEAQLIALRGVQEASPASPPVGVPPPSPEPSTKPIALRVSTPAAKPEPPPIVTPEKPGLEPLSPDALSRFTLPDNASRTTVEAYIRRIAETIPANVGGWRNSDKRVEALARIPAQQLPALLKALDAYPQNPMHSFIESAIPLVAKPDQEKIILPLLVRNPQLIDVVELQHWQRQARPQVLAWLTEKQDARFLSLAAPFVRALLVEPDPDTYPLITEVFLRSKCGYWQRDIYHAVENAPGLDLDTLVTTVWERGGAYEGWEAFAPIAAQHGHVDALKAVIARVADHPPSHLPADKARAWLAERTDAPEDPAGAAVWLAADPVYDVQRRRWHAKDATLPPATNF